MLGCYMGSLIDPSPRIDNNFVLAGHQLCTGCVLSWQGLTIGEQWIRVGGIEPALERAADQREIETCWRMVSQVGDCIVVGRHLTG